jgi:hypothetical protein
MQRQGSLLALSGPMLRALSPHSDELDSTHTAPHFGHRISSRKIGL